MNHDDCIIHVYCMVCDEYASIRGKTRLRQAGFDPAFTDEEVITLEVCGELFGCNTDTAIYTFFANHYRHFFPKLPTRTTFVRQAANLWQVKQMLQQRLVRRFGQKEEPIQIIDTVPVPVCALVRSYHERNFKPEATYSRCTAKDLRYYGFKLGLRITLSGMIVHFGLLEARLHDVNQLSDLLAGFTGVALADKGFTHQARQLTLATKGIELITPPRRHTDKQLTQQLAESVPPACQRQFRRWRKQIETVAAQLVERLGVARIRVRDRWHLEHRLIRKILAHTVAVALNLQLGLPPLHFAALLQP